MQAPVITRPLLQLLKMGCTMRSEEQQVFERSGRRSSSTAPPIILTKLPARAHFLNFKNDTTEPGTDRSGTD